MKIPNIKIENFVSTNIYRNTFLMYIYCDINFLYASDGFILLKIPIEDNLEKFCGFIEPEVFKYARRVKCDYIEREENNFFKGWIINGKDLPSVMIKDEFENISKDSGKQFIEIFNNHLKEYDNEFETYYIFQLERLFRSFSTTQKNNMQIVLPKKKDSGAIILDSNFFNAPIGIIMPTKESNNFKERLEEYKKC